MRGPAPWLQDHWDWRAAGNFMFGGTGTGLLIFGALGLLHDLAYWPIGLVGLACVGAGLSLVWLEIGKPLRALHVFFHPHTSWMTREGLVALPLFACGAAAVFLGWRWAAFATGALALVFLFCQGRILYASKGIPAWRHRLTPWLIIVTGLTEGAGFYTWLAPLVLMGTIGWIDTALLALIALRIALFWMFRMAMRDEGAPSGTLAALARMSTPFQIVGHAVPAALLLIAYGAGDLALPLQALAGLLAFVSGWQFKFALVTRAAFNQGFALPRMPARGGGRSAPGVKPGWS